MLSAQSTQGGNKLTVALPSGLTVVAINTQAGPHGAGFIEGDESVMYTYRGPQGHFVFTYEDCDLRLVNHPDGIAHAAPDCPGEVHFAFHGFSADPAFFAFRQSS